MADNKNLTNEELDEVSGGVIERKYPQKEGVMLPSGHVMPGAGFIVCMKCEGQGKLWEPKKKVFYTCPECDGYGFVMEPKY